MDLNTLLMRRHRALGAGAPLFYDKPLHIVRGEGTYLYDTEAAAMSTCTTMSPASVTATLRVVEAMARQQATLNVHSPLSARRASSPLPSAFAALHGPGDRKRDLLLQRYGGQSRSRCGWRGSQPATAVSFAPDASYHGNSEAG